MEKCFVIQPFDGGKYDKRFNDTYKPAIEECGLEAYRVDKDPNSQIPIDDIDMHIRNSCICLADITEDNPNVWFELGLAIAYNKDVVLICSNERTGKFPFDVQHRSITSYSSESLSDFDMLKEKIKQKINALKQLQNTSKDMQNKSMAKTTDGLEPHEKEVLVTIASFIDSPNDGVSIYSLREKLESQGLTPIGITLGLKKLLILDFIEFSLDHDHNGNEWTSYKMNDKGMNWLMDNKSILELITKIPNITNDNNNGLVDDIPF